MDIKIEKLVYGGEGLGHHDGHTVFVPFVLPDEVVSVRPTDQKKKFVRGRVEQVVTPSPQRASPPCRHFTVCGGCHYQHIPYQAQLQYKAEILRETLGRIGRVEWGGPIETHASPPFGYRNRAQWKVRPAGPGGKTAIGYFQSGSSTLCAVEECPILSPRLTETLAALRDLIAQGKLPSTLGEVEVFADSADQKTLLNASFESFDAPPAILAQTLRDALPSLETILLQETRREHFELIGPGFVHYQVAESRYRVGHLSFFQVNRFLMEELVRAVVPNEQGGLALDLFAGVGLFTLPLARRFARVVGVESDLAAARDLQANIDAAKVNAQHVNATVESLLGRWEERPDFAVLDPPRAGVSGPALVRLVQIAPARITYLSCDPATLARDLSTLTGGAGAAGAYEITALHLFDVFPQTFHIESLVALRRRE
ncbi:MAG: 23S rRNA (uracil(1939)-C(5))-methyltransferase RlmD [Acidobacteria bacterium]|nr:MAG: 23S rRNA (uracil(1939)-C(5))-methyltransferase RlmD [Acidobacteriota bacterium]